MSGWLKPLRRSAWRYLSDRDILRAAVVTVLVFVFSLGLVFVAHFVRVWRVARLSPAMATNRGTVLVFGRRLVNDMPESNFIDRLGRARQMAEAGLADRVLLLGGVSGGGPTSEAEAGRRWLQAARWPDGVPLLLEPVSIDSLENLRHAREILRDRPDDPLPPVWLLSSRYHLARCLYLARRLGFDASPVAAEDAMPLRWRYIVHLAMEAGYLMWIDTGMRWAEVTGNRRMAARIS